MKCPYCGSTAQPRLVKDSPNDFWICGCGAKWNLAYDLQTVEHKLKLLRCLSQEGCKYRIGGYCTFDGKCDLRA